MFCRASTALWAFDRNTWAHAHPPHCPPERQKWDLSDKLPPLSRTLWKWPVKGLWIWAVVLWLLVFPASPCTCGLFLECQLHMQPVGCSWDCKWQLLLLNDTWVVIEKHGCAEYLAPPPCLSWILYLHYTWALSLAHHPPPLLLENK